MIRQVSLAIILSTAANHSFAQQSQQEQASSSKQEAIGVVSGLTFGAAVGGPPGALIGSVIGGLIGNGEGKRVRLGLAEAELRESKQLLAEVRAESRRFELAYNGARQQVQELAQQKEQLAKLRNAASASLQTPIKADNTLFNIHFRSGSAHIEPHYQSQLSSIAQLAKQLPEYAIEISGHADRSGDEKPNQNLSLRRSEAVKATLKRMGIQDSAIRVTAQGESKPLHPRESLESNFFDRRVQLRLIDPSSHMLSGRGN